MKKIILIIIVSLLLNGCAVYRVRRPTPSRKNLEERNFDELPSNVQDWLRKEGLDDVWYNGN